MEYKVTHIVTSHLRYGMDFNTEHVLTYIPRNLSKATNFPSFVNGHFAKFYLEFMKKLIYFLGFMLCY